MPLHQLVDPRFRAWVKSSALGRLLLWPLRLNVALGATLPALGRSLAWCFVSREHTNFTYDLTPLNLRYLTAFVAEVTGKDFAVIEGYAREIQEDQAFKDHV